jgi:hypothetical protein
MFSYWRACKTGGVILSAAGLILLFRSGTVAQAPPGIRSLPLTPRNVFLDNGSLQPGLPGAIATLPLFLRNGGHFGFGSGGFQQFTLTNPQALIMPTGSGGAGAGGAGAAGGSGSCGGGFSGGVNTGQATNFGGAGAGQPSAFFPCSLNQGQFVGALVQRIFLDGFIPQYNVAVPPQIHGGIPTLPVQMASGFGSLQGTLFIGVNGAAGAAGLNGIQGQQVIPPLQVGVGGKIGFSGMQGNCY